MNVHQWDCCVQNGRRAWCRRSITTTVQTIQSADCKCFNATNRFGRRYVPMAEASTYHFSLESNWQLADWTAAGKTRSKWRKAQTSASKMLPSVFSAFFAKERTTKSEYYTASFVHLKEIFSKSNGHKWRRKRHLSPAQFSMLKLDRNDLQTSWIALQFFSAPSVFPRSGPVATTGSLQIWNECFRDKDFASMKKGYWKLRRILRIRTNLSNF